jgi:hypothetical protein
MSKKLITNQTLNHGMGSRVLKMINVYAYADFLRSKGLDFEYIHTPFHYEGFGYNFSYNELFLYHYNEVKNHREEYLGLCHRWDGILKYQGKTVKDFQESELIPLVHPNLFGEVEIDPFNHTRLIKDRIKNDFLITNFEKNVNKKINVHIRRGDVNHGTHSDRWISDEHYLYVIERLKERFSDSTVTIYTQKKNFNSGLFTDYNIKFDDELSDDKTWLELINSDVLVIGKSAFSYSAGILCDGLVIYPSDDMFHPKLYDWKKIEEI